MGAKKAILFDFWGTLVENGVYSPVRQVRTILRLDMPFQEYIVAFEECFMVKKWDSLSEAFTAVCKTFDIKADTLMIERLVGMWNKNTLLSKPFPETLEVLDDLKRDFKIGLVSNTDQFSVEQVLEKYKLLDLLDGVALSYETGALKTNPNLFKAALKKMKLKPDQTIMVGDSLESDMKGAENAGIKGVLVDRRGRREFSPKIGNLRELRSVL
ncbi:MAG: HAD family hydrolase [Nanoarchaeota archaeon]